MSTWLEKVIEQGREEDRFASTPFAELMARAHERQRQKQAFREGFIHALNAMREMQKGGFQRTKEICNVLENFASEELKDYAAEKGEAWNSTAPKVWQGGDWWQIRQKVLARDGHVCRWCGSTESLQIDHIHPVAEGGGPYLGNLQVLCKACNLQKGTS